GTKKAGEVASMDSNIEPGLRRSPGRKTTPSVGVKDSWLQLLPLGPRVRTVPADGVETGHWCEAGNEKELGLRIDRKQFWLLRSLALGVFHHEPSLLI